MAKLTVLSAEKKGWEANESYAELELNQVAFPFTGRIEAQTPLTAEVGGNAFIGEVGMILVVDKWNLKDPTDPTKGFDPVVRPVDTNNDDETALFAINYSTELVYDERKPALRFFHQKRGTYNYDWLGNGTNDDIYPRLGYLSVGDRFTTSAITVTEGTAAALDAAIDGYAGKYFEAGADGYWVETSTPTSAIGPVIRVIDPTIGMADGSYGFKVECVKA